MVKQIGEYSKDLRRCFEIKAVLLLSLSKKSVEPAPYGKGAKKAIRASVKFNYRTILSGTTLFRVLILFFLLFLKATIRITKTRHNTQTKNIQPSGWGIHTCTVNSSLARVRYRQQPIGPAELLFCGVVWRGVEKVAQKVNIRSAIMRKHTESSGSSG